MKVDTDPKKIDDIFGRGIVADVVPLKEKLISDLKSGKRLRFYMGIDITADAIHLGHAGNLLLLEDFRKLGHEIIVVLGDFTALIGDPTGKESARQARAEKEISENIVSYKNQVGKAVSLTGENAAAIRKNSEWLSKLNLGDMLQLAQHFTAQQMLERDMFAKRIDTNAPIYLHEFLYPLLQGFDSVALETDVEVGGTDQLFNMLAGRTILERMKGKEKFVITTNLLQDERGVLMSKSAGTGIFLNETPEGLFGAVMSQSDQMIHPLLVHATRVPLMEIDGLKDIISKGGKDARDAKLSAAEAVVATYFSQNEASSARDTFVSTFSEKDLTGIQEIKLPYAKEKLFIALVDAKLAGSNTDAKRLIEEGAVEIEGNVVKDPFVEIEVAGISVRVGKHRFAKLIS